MIGRGKGAGIVFLIDFGLVKRYKDSKTGAHIAYKDNKGMIGTARFVSINTHLGIGKFIIINIYIKIYLYIFNFLNY